MFNTLKMYPALLLSTLENSLSYKRSRIEQAPTNKRMTATAQKEIMDKAQAKRDRRANRGW